MKGAIGVVYQPIERGAAQRCALQCWRLRNGRHREVKECCLCSIRIVARLEVRPLMQLRTSNYNRSDQIMFLGVFFFLISCSVAETTVAALLAGEFAPTGPFNSFKDTYTKPLALADLLVL